MFLFLTDLRNTKLLTDKTSKNNIRKQYIVKSIAFIIQFTATINCNHL